MNTYSNTVRSAESTNIHRMLGRNIRYTVIDDLSMKVMHTKDELLKLSYNIENKANNSITITYNINSDKKTVKLENKYMNKHNDKIVVTSRLRGEPVIKDSTFYIKDDCEFNTEIENVGAEYDLYEVRKLNTSELVFYRAIPIGASMQYYDKKQETEVTEE